MTDIVRLLALVKELTAFGEANAGTTTTANVGAFVKGWVQTDSPDSDEDKKKKKGKPVGT